MESFNMPGLCGFQNASGREILAPDNNRVQCGFATQLESTPAITPATVKSHQMQLPSYHSFMQPQNTAHARVGVASAGEQNGPHAEPDYNTAAQTAHRKNGSQDTVWFPAAAPKPLATTILLASEPDPKRSSDQPRASFLSEAPEYPFRIPAGPPVHFTLVDVLAIMLNWYPNLFFATRFLNNGLNSSEHVAILREYRDLTLSGLEVHHAKDHVSDRYRKTMRKIDSRWSKYKHRAPQGWDHHETTVNMFLQDAAREPGWIYPAPIPFKTLCKGLKKLPQGADAGDLTHALSFAMKNKKTGPNGEHQEFMFPDDLHVILGAIGYTNITADHFDGAIVKRYKLVVKAENVALNKRLRELKEAGESAPPPKRRHVKKVKESSTEVKTSQQVANTLPRGLSSGVYMSQTEVLKTPQPAQVTVPGDSFPPGVFHPMTPVLNQSHANSPGLVQVSVPGESSSMMSPMGDQLTSSVPSFQPFAPAPHTSQTARALFEPLTGVNEPNSSQVTGTKWAQNIGGDTRTTTAMNHFQQWGGATLRPFHHGVESVTSEDHNMNADTPQQTARLHSEGKAIFDPVANEMSDNPFVRYSSSYGEIDSENTTSQSHGHNMDTGGSCIGSMAEMDALLAPYQDVDNSSILFPGPSIYFPLDHQADIMTGIEQINAWPQYQDTQLLRDCMEADDPNDCSDLARAARWCRNPDNKAEEYLVGHAWLALSFEKMLADADCYEQDL
jgi:hypothetical protein